MGRYSYSSRGIVEDSVSIGIDDLKEWGFWGEGSYGGVLTINSELHGKIAELWAGVNISERDGSFIQFKYSINGKPVEYNHTIERIPCYYGGYRYYFRCRKCHRRVSRLYFHYGYYACRHCQNLVYICSRHHRSPNYYTERYFFYKDKAEKLRKRGHPRKANSLKLKTRVLELKGLMNMMEWASIE